MTFSEGAFVRIRLDGRCSVQLGTVVTGFEGGNLRQRTEAAHHSFRHQVEDLRGHRPQADGRRGKVIRIVPGDDHPYQVLYVDDRGRDAPLQLDAHRQVVGGAYAAEELIPA